MTTDRRMISVTGEQYELTAGDYCAVITELGAGLRRLSYGGEELLLTYPEHNVPPAAAGQALIPWPNRIARGRYRFEGTEYQLDINDHRGGNASHGLTRWLPWRVIDTSRAEISLEVTLLGTEGYPFVLDLMLTYKLTTDHGLSVTLTASNCGEKAAPFGFGMHPYLSVGEIVDQCTLHLPALNMLSVDDQGIPTGRENVMATRYDFRQPRAVGSLAIDNTFTELKPDENGRVEICLSGSDRSVVLWQDETFSYVQIYTAEWAGRRALAVEPMTCPANAFQTAEDLIVLRPGSMTTHSFGIRHAGTVR